MLKHCDQVIKEYHQQLEESALAERQKREDKKATALAIMPRVLDRIAQKIAQNPEDLIGTAGVQIGTSWDLSDEGKDLDIVLPYLDDVLAPYGYQLSIRTYDLDYYYVRQRMFKLPV